MNKEYLVVDFQNMKRLGKVSAKNETAARLKATEVFGEKTIVIKEPRTKKLYFRQ